MIDWPALERLLIDQSEMAVKAFFVEHGDEPLSAIGYWVCERIGYVSPPPFAITANPRDYFEAELATTKAANPNFTDARMRWDSGYFKFPACIEIGPEVAEMASTLNNLVSAGTVTGEEASGGMFKICCAAMVALARNGLFGDPAKIDFVIQNANDSWYENEMQGVRARDAAVHAMIG